MPSFKPMQFSEPCFTLPGIHLALLWQGSDWEVSLSSSDDEEGLAGGGDEGDDGGDAELENLRREAAGGSPQLRGSARRKRGADTGREPDVVRMFRPV